MKNFRCYAVILLLLGTINGCGSVMSSAGAGPIEEDPGERTFGQQMTDESIETKAQVKKAIQRYCKTQLTDRARRVTFCYCSLHATMEIVTWHKTQGLIFESNFLNQNRCAGDAGHASNAPEDPSERHPA